MVKRMRTSAQRYQRYAMVFCAAVALLAVLVLLASLGRVHIRITPRVETMDLSGEVTLIASGTPQGAEVLGRLLRVDGAASVRMPTGVQDASAAVVTGAPAAASVETPVRARGTVTLVNTHSSAQPLIATTRLLAQGDILFRITKGVIVPARGRLADIEVVADETGAGGNVAPTKFTIPGLSPWLQSRIWAESTQPMSGGVGPGPSAAPAMPARAPVAPARTVSATDLAAASARATQAARDDAQRRLFAAAQTWEQAIEVDEEASVRTDSAAGQAKPQVGADATVTITAIVVDRRAWQDALVEVMRAAAAAQGRSIVRGIDGAAAIEVIAYDPETMRARIAYRGRNEVILPAASDVFAAQRIVGFTPEAVRSYLTAIPGVASVDVQLSPFWLRRVPVDLDAVEVEIRPPAP